MTNKNIKNAAIYIRVSDDEILSRGYPDFVLQEEGCERFCASHELSTDHTHKYMEAAPGNLSPNERRGLKQLLEAAKRKEFGVVVVYKIDRIARNLKILLDVVHELEELGVIVQSATEPFDMSTPFGKTTFNMLGVFAEYEKSTIRARLNPSRSLE